MFIVGLNKARPSNLHCSTLIYFVMQKVTCTVSLLLSYLACRNHEITERALSDLEIPSSNPAHSVCSPARQLIHIADLYPGE